MLLLLLLLLSRQIICTSYYFNSVSGNDANNGLSPNSAFKTLNANVDIEYEGGDSIFFSRGSSFFLSSNPFRGSNTSDMITFSAYGTGKNPRFTNTIEFTDPSQWEPIQNNAPFFSGSIYSNSSNLWVLKPPVTTITGLDIITHPFPDTPLCKSNLVDMVDYNCSSFDDNIIELVYDHPGIDNEIELTIDVSTILKDQLYKVHFSYCGDDPYSQIRVNFSTIFFSFTDYPLEECSREDNSTWRSVEFLLKSDVDTNNFTIWVRNTGVLEDYLRFSISDITVFPVSLVGIPHPLFNTFLTEEYFLLNVWYGNDLNVFSLNEINTDLSEIENSEPKSIHVSYKNHAILIKTEGLNPITQYGTINFELVQSLYETTNMVDQHHIIFDGLWLDKMLDGSYAFLGSGCHDIIVRNCLFSNFIDYIFNLDSHKDIIIEYNKIWKGFLSAFFLQDKNYEDNTYYENINIHHNIIYGVKRALFLYQSATNVSYPLVSGTFHFAHNLVIWLGKVSCSTPSQGFYAQINRNDIDHLPEGWIHNNLFAQYERGCSFYYGSYYFRADALETSLGSNYLGNITSHIHTVQNNFYNNVTHMITEPIDIIPYIYYDKSLDQTCFEDDIDCFVDYGISYDPILSFNTFNEPALTSSFISDCTATQWNITFTPHTCPYCSSNTLDFNGVRHGINPSIGPFQTCYSPPPPPGEFPWMYVYIGGGAAGGICLLVLLSIVYYFKKIRGQSSTGKASWAAAKKLDAWGDEIKKEEKVGDAKISPPVMSDMNISSPVSNDSKNPSVFRSELDMFEQSLGGSGTEECTLPPNWIEKFDPQYQRNYYVNMTTGDKSWTIPSM